MPLVCYVLEQNLNVPLDSDRLLRLLGVSVKLSGFYYAVYMLEQVQQKPDHVLLITKRLYKQTAQHFETTAAAWNAICGRWCGRAGVSRIIPCWIKSLAGR